MENNREHPGGSLCFCCLNSSMLLGKIGLKMNLLNLGPLLQHLSLTSMASYTFCTTSVFFLPLPRLEAVPTAKLLSSQAGYS